MSQPDRGRWDESRFGSVKSDPEMGDVVREDRIHRAVSTDGTEVAGRVQGVGPPLVLIHGGLSDGDQAWGPLLAFLEARFTCYLISTRGRGLSAAPADEDYSLERLVEDVVSFVDSIGQPVGLVGHSLGGALALGAAANSTVVSAVAVYEPAVFEAPSEVNPRAEAKAARIGEAVADSRLAEAAREMVEGAVTDDEMAAISRTGVLESWATNVRVALQEAQQAGESRRPTPTDASALTRLDVPVLYLHGSHTPTTWYVEGARHVADHVVDFRQVEVVGAAHLTPHFAPELIADELIQFFEAVPELA
jgi:pimeloyl-ACP methyl ester carboxylesterase